MHGLIHFEGKQEKASFSSIQNLIIRNKLKLQLREKQAGERKWEEVCRIQLG